jgi:hypothetical protein
MHLADLARLAFQVVTQDMDFHAGCLGSPGGGLQALLWRRHEVHGMPAEQGVARFGGLQPARLQRREHRCRQVDGVTAHHRQRILATGRIGHGGTTANGGRVIPRHIADGQRDHPRRCAGGSQPAPLDARKVLAHAVHLRDAGATGQQGLVQGLLLRQRQQVDRQRQKGGCATGHQTQHQVLRLQPLRQSQHALCRGKPGGIGNRMGGLDHLDALHQSGRPRWHMVVTGDHQAAQGMTGRPQGLDRLRHGAGRLARTQHQRAAPRGRVGRGRKERAHAVQGQCPRHGRLEEVFEKRAGLRASVRDGMVAAGHGAWFLAPLCRLQPACPTPP